MLTFSVEVGELYIIHTSRSRAMTVCGKSVRLLSKLSELSFDHCNRQAEVAIVTPEVCAVPSKSSLGNADRWARMLKELTDWRGS